MIITIDPGVKHSGVAYWDNFDGRYFLRSARLVSCRLNTLAAAVRFMPRACGLRNISINDGVEFVIVELPQVYTRDKSKGNPNDLIGVAAVAGALAACLDLTESLLVLPAEWKGQSPKHVTKNRCEVDLCWAELERIDLPMKSLQHNVWDAIGIGLWYLKKERLRSATPEQSMQGRGVLIKPPSADRRPTSSARGPRRSSP